MRRPICELPLEECSACLLRIASPGAWKAPLTFSPSFLSFSLSFFIWVKLSPTSDAEACLFKWNPHPPPLPKMRAERKKEGGRQIWEQKSDKYFLFLDCLTCQSVVVFVGSSWYQVNEYSVSVTTTVVTSHSPCVYIQCTQPPRLAITLTHL